MSLRKVIYFPPSWDGTHKNPKICYVVEKWGQLARGQTNICEQYFDKQGNDNGLRDALEGRGSHVKNEYIIEYTDAVWEACQKYIRARKAALERFAQDRETLRKGKNPYAFKQLSMFSGENE